MATGPRPIGWDPRHTHTGMARAARADLRVGREFCAGCWGAGRIRAAGEWHRCQWCGGDGVTIVLRDAREAA